MAEHLFVPTHVPLVEYCADCDLITLGEFAKSFRPLPQSAVWWLWPISDNFTQSSRLGATVRGLMGSLLGLSELRPLLLLRQLAAECIGTLLLVLVGCGRCSKYLCLCSFYLYLWSLCVYLCLCSFYWWAVAGASKLRYKRCGGGSCCSSRSIVSHRLAQPPPPPGFAKLNHAHFESFWKDARIFPWPPHNISKLPFSCMGGDQEDGATQLGDQVRYRWKMGEIQHKGFESEKVKKKDF